MNKLEKSYIKREFRLRNTAMRRRPRAKQRPDTFDGIHMNLTKTIPIPIVITRILARQMANKLVRVSPLRQSIIDVEFIGMNRRTPPDRRQNMRTYALLANIGKYLQKRLATSLKHTENRWFFLLQRSTPTRPFQTPATRFSVFFSAFSGCPLYPATVYNSSHSTSPWRTGSGLRSTTPSRSVEVISWMSDSRLIRVLGRFARWKG